MLNAEVCTLQVRIKLAKPQGLSASPLQDYAVVFLKFNCIGNFD